MTKKFAKIEVIVNFPSTLTSDEVFDDWLLTLDKVVTSKGVCPMYSNLLSVHNTDPTDADSKKE